MASKPGTMAPAATGLPTAFGPAAMQAWVDMGTEAVRFVWDRLHQDIKTQQAMLACTSLDQMQHIQVEFFRAAQDQYAAQAGKMLQMITQSPSPGPAGSPTARKYDDVPL